MRAAATALVFEAGVAGAGGVAAGFGGFADGGRCAGLCRILNCWVVHNAVRGVLFLRDDEVVRGFEIDEGVDDIAEGFGLYFGGGFEHGESGAEAEDGGGLGIHEDLIKDFEGFRGEFDGSLVPDEGLFAHGEFDFAGEGGYGAAPVADGIAMNAGIGGGLSDGLTFGEKRQHMMLRRGEGGMGRILRGFGSW